VCLTLASFSTATPIVISDGPDTQTQSQGASKRIIETDGPQEWVNASQSGQALVGSWVIETDGPGKGRLVGPNVTPTISPVALPRVVLIDSPEPVNPPKHTTKKIVKKKNAVLPDAETSTLAPAIPASSPTTLPFASGAAWTMITILGVMVLSFLGALVWKRRNTEG
jgi:hypothetical protein